MKRLVAIMFLCVIFVICAIGFTACSITNSGNSGDNSSATETVDAQIKSVYNMYVANAEANGEKPISYEEWLATIKGEKGEKGEKGDKGDAGTDGKDGVDGVSPTIEISEDGFWIINDIKTEYKAIGADGKDGVDGKDGTGGNTAAENPQELDFYPKDDDTYEVYVGKAKLLSNIVIPATYKGKAVTSIGDYAFKNCSSLTSVTIGNSVTSIGNYAFEDCRSLTSITIPDSVTSIGYYAFCGCSGLTSIKISNNNTAYKSIDDNLYSKDGTILIQYAIGKTETEFTIPESVTSIGIFAFSGCRSLSEITIPDSVTSIGYNAFRDCPIETAKIPAIACSYIKNDKLKTVEITSGDSIGNYAFYDCSSLTSVTIGNSVTSIGEWAFRNCSSLKSITFNGTKEQWNTIEKNSSWNYDSAITQVVCTNGTI